MIPQYPFYLFDLDGTLLDSAEDICGAVRQILSATADAPQPSFEFLKKYIGLHLIALFTDLFPHYSPEQIEPLIQQYRAEYPKRDHAATHLYPGVTDALSQLGGRKATATTKATVTTRIVLEKFGLLRYFDHVQGTDGFPCKPAPDVLLASMKALGAAPSETLMVGDSPADMEAARAAGVKVCAVRYGYGDPAELAKWKPDYWVSDLRELLLER